MSIETRLLASGISGLIGLAALAIAAWTFIRGRMKRDPRGWTLGFRWVGIGAVGCIMNIFFIRPAEGIEVGIVTIIGLAYAIVRTGGMRRVK